MTNARLCRLSVRGCLSLLLPLRSQFCLDMLLTAHRFKIASSNYSCFCDISVDTAHVFAAGHAGFVSRTLHTGVDCRTRSRSGTAPKRLVSLASGVCSVVCRVFGRICAQAWPHAVQALSQHVEWILLPAMHLLKCLNGLARPGVLGGATASLAAALDLSPLEKAAAIGQAAFIDAKSRADELEPGRLDPCTVHGVRGWIKQGKELVRSILVGLHCAGATMWQLAPPPAAHTLHTAACVLEARAAGQASVLVQHHPRLQ
jgi:hypothetical protein